MENLKSQAIIDGCTAKEAAITAATTIEGLMTAVQGAQWIQ